jgi:hypothetical protein
VDRLLTEARDVDHQPLPPEFEEITGDSVFLLDGEFAEFLEYVVPSLEDSSPSLSIHNKGGFKC